MGDYEEQQSMEIEALESILMDDLKEVADNIPSGWSVQGTAYRVEIIPQLEEDTSGDYSVGIELVFAHTPAYPDDAPLLKARSLRGLADAEVAALQSLLEGQVDENLGMPMIYTLITSAQDWVNERAAEMAVPVVDPEAERKQREEEEEARIAALRAHGTPVTPETFKEWKLRFDAEMQVAKMELQDPGLSAAAAKGKMTGKAWFLQQEAQHIEIEEPDLEEDEEDGEGSRSDWSGEDNEEGFDENAEFSDEDDEDMLNDMLASRLEY